MGEEITVVMCGQCGMVLDEPPDSAVEKRAPCPDCSSTSRQFRKVFTAEVGLKSGVKGKARSGEAGKPGGKPWLTFKSEHSWSTRYEKWMQREKRRIAATTDTPKL